MKKIIGDNYVLIQGDNLEWLKTRKDNSIDAIVTDPPYGLGKEPDALKLLKDWIDTGHHDVKSKAGFMGKEWDAFVPQPIFWKECLRVLKPGGHILTFGGTRTYDLVTLGLRIAGFEIRDVLQWIYGSGFPKSHDISKALDKIAGAEREVIGKGVGRTGEKSQPNAGSVLSDDNYKWPGQYDITLPTSDEAKQWEGWGTALKPAYEPIIMARKPIEKGLNVAQNVLKWGVGGINIDGCRVPVDVDIDASQIRTLNRSKREKDNNGQVWGMNKSSDDTPQVVSIKGRFPANVIHDGSDEVLEKFPDSKGAMGDVKGTEKSRIGDDNTVTYGKYNDRVPQEKRNDDGSAARFFYCAKASKKDRDEGLDELDDKTKLNPMRSANGTGEKNFEGRFPDAVRKNIHPTVKPTTLMQYLVRMITPKGGIVLDPFMGSGSTGKAVLLEGCKFIGVEFEDEYVEIAKHRIQYIKDKMTNG